MTEPIVTEPIVEMITDSTGFPRHAVRVTVPETAWRQDNGFPGLARFEVFDCGATEMDGTPIYNASATGNDTTHSLDWAERSAWGEVKWDGCVNYEVGTEGVMLHNCDEEGLGYFLRAITRGYALALTAVGGGL